jgi:hypothetical protein
MPTLLSALMTILMALTPHSAPEAVVKGDSTG